MHDTPADCAMMVDPILSPSARMGAPLGPMNAMWVGVFSRVSGSRSFSEAWPHPAHTASTLYLQQGVRHAGQADAGRADSRSSGVVQAPQHLGGWDVERERE